VRATVGQKWAEKRLDRGKILPEPLVVRLESVKKIETITIWST
jgi:hypothetical protein